jgi:predicted HTH transcriptional regulator
MTSILDNLDQLLQQGEGERLEFKADVGEPRRLARDLAAFANARGGVLVVGVDESRGVVTRNVDPARVAASVARAVALIEPQLHYSGRELVVDGATLYAVEVPEQPGRPFAVDGQLYVRRGATSDVATPDLMTSLVMRREVSSAQLIVQLESFAQALGRQAQLIEKLERSSTWQRQLFWTLFGAALGTLLGVVATILTR